EFGPGPPPVVGIHDALAPPRARVGGDEDIVFAALPSRAIEPVHDRAAGERPVAEPTGIDRDRQLLPVHQVAAHGVSPMHVAPAPSVGIVLEVKMVLAAGMDEPIRVVVPAAAGREVEAGA